jgi:hypothetical protein
MPRADVRILSDILEPTVTIVCAPCGRWGRYGVARPIERYGADAKMPDLLGELANRPKTRSGRMLRIRQRKMRLGRQVLTQSTFHIA